MVRRSLEDHVLQQVGHARLAVALMPRADQDRQVDGDLGPRRVGEEQHLQPVVQPVLGDSLDRGDLAGRGRFCAGGNTLDSQAQHRGRKPIRSASSLMANSRFSSLADRVSK